MLVCFHFLLLSFNQNPAWYRRSNVDAGKSRKPSSAQCFSKGTGLAANRFQVPRIEDRSGCASFLLKEIPTCKGDTAELGITSQSSKDTTTAQEIESAVRGSCNCHVDTFLECTVSLTGSRTAQNPFGKSPADM